MRRWLLLLLFGPGLCAAAALPAAAHSTSTQGRVITAGVPTRHPPPPRVPFRHHRNFARPFVPLFPFGFIQPVPIFPGGVLDGVADADALAPAGGRAPIVIVTPGSSGPQHAIGSAVDERPSVETTPQGVVIVRGPGSRHLDR